MVCEMAPDMTDPDASSSASSDGRADPGIHGDSGDGSPSSPAAGCASSLAGKHLYIVNLTTDRKHEAAAVIDAVCSLTTGISRAAPIKN